MVGDSGMDMRWNGNVMRVIRELHILWKALRHHQLQTQPWAHVAYVPQIVALGDAWEYVLVILVASHPNVVPQIPVE